MRAAENHRVAARLPDRSRVLAHGLDDHFAEVSPPSISGTSFGHATAVKCDACIERAARASRSGPR